MITLILTALSQVCWAQSTYPTRQRVIKESGLSFLEPIGAGWTCDEPDWDVTTRVINYIKRLGPKKEFSILIQPHVGADVTDPQLQEKYVEMIVQEPGPVNSDVDLHLGMPTFVVDYERERSGDRVVRVRGLLAFKNGYAFRIVSDRPDAL